MITQRKRIAVVGSGISGLSAAWLLAQRHAVTLYEAAPRLGGHTNTVDVTLDGVTHPVDTGFLVFNHKTYPNLTALFDHSSAWTAVESEMSFAVSLEATDGSSGPAPDLATPVRPEAATWCGRNSGACCQDILRFNRESTWPGCSARHDPRVDGPAAPICSTPVATRHAFRDWYLIPMAAAIWSCPTRSMLAYPLATFVRFCHNHGLLQVFDRPRGTPCRNGARSYVDKLAAGIGTCACGTPVLDVFREAGFGVAVRTRAVWSVRRGGVRLPQRPDPGPARRRRQRGRAARAGGRQVPAQRCLAAHRHAPAAPRARCLVGLELPVRPRRAEAERPVSVSYLLNRLQPLPVSGTPVVLSLNPAVEPGGRRPCSRYLRPPGLRRPGHRRPARTARPVRGATASGSAAPGAATASTRTDCKLRARRRRRLRLPRALARPAGQGGMMLGEDPVHGFGDARAPAAAGAAPLHLSGVRPAAAARPAGPG
jgi:hypothetical protein